MPRPEDERPVEYLGGPARRLFMRYPWHVSTIVGILLVTLLRPCTRHVPEPPPVVATIPSFTLQEAGRGIVTERELLGHVWIAGFVCADCDGPASQVGPMLSGLAERIQTHKKTIRLLAIGLNPSRDSPDVMAAWAASNGLSPTVGRALGGTDSSVRTLREKTISSFGGQPNEPWARIFIIDDQARLRGSYSLGELGADEAYHRAQHVARESRARRGESQEEP